MTGERAPRIELGITPDGDLVEMDVAPAVALVHELVVNADQRAATQQILVDAAGRFGPDWPRVAMAALENMTIGPMAAAVERARKVDTEHLELLHGAYRIVIDQHTAAPE